MRGFGLSGMNMVLRTMVPRCATRSAKLITRRPSAERLVAFFAFAVSDGSVLTTGERRLGFSFLDPAKIQNRAKARSRRLLVHRAHKAELRARFDQPVDDHRNHKIAMTPRY